MKKLHIDAGKDFETELYGKVVVVEYINSAKVKVRFLTTGVERFTTIRELRLGKVVDTSVKNIKKMRCAEDIVASVREDIVGKEFETNNCGKCVVVAYEGWNKVTVRFIEYPCLVKTRRGCLVSGVLRNPMYPSVLGKGYMGVGEYGSKDRKVVNLWNNMLGRAFDDKRHAVRSDYKGVTVCEEWLNFQNFAKWFYSQQFHNAIDDHGRSYHLDKDIIVKGNKIYSPENCCFVPNEINVLLTKRRKSRGDNPIGVQFHKKTQKFQASLSVGGIKNKYLGLYSSQVEAFQAYKEAKESYIKEVAEKWKGRISEKVYLGLLNYEVSVED